jgi:DNA-binding beta-propeller fold protein YncE
VYPLDATGDVAPLRVIKGEKTQLNWPAGMTIDPEEGTLYVANDSGHSVLAFRVGDDGDVAPHRIIKGSRTGLVNPTGVAVDGKARELWVSSFGNHSASVFPLSANGDVAPLRTIRAAPKGEKALGIGNPGAVAYDTKRQEILVPN